MAIRGEFRSLSTDISLKSDMARVNRSPQVLNFFIYFCFTICCLSSYVNATRELDEDNWREILQGEWMVEL